MYDYNKLIERPKDMVRRRKNLEAVAAVLDTIGVRWWLYEGALLGFYRDGDFIAWDFDVDILMDSTYMVENYAKICGAVSETGLTAKEDARTRVGIRPKIKVDSDGEPISINGYRFTETEVVREPYRFPLEWWSDGTIEQWGVKYPCPTPIEDYLEAAYGCWKTPICSGNPNEYRRGRGVRSLGVERTYRKAKKRGEY